MVWLLLFSVLLILFMVGIVWYRVREGRFLKKSTREAIDPRLREQWDQEDKDAERRKEKFNQELKKFGF